MSWQWALVSSLPSTATTAVNPFWFYTTNTTAATTTSTYNQLTNVIWAQQAFLQQQAIQPGFPTEYFQMRQATIAAHVAAVQAQTQAQQTEFNRQQAVDRQYLNDLGAASYEVHRRQQDRVLTAAPKPAIDRARDLLLENLTPTQRAQFERHGFFVIEGGKSRTKYRIRSDLALVANIEVLAENERVVYRVCAHGRPDIMPLFDHLLAQKLSLENDEETFLKIANRHAA
jgi:hypothetical protein